jgi:hypothetical protein
MSKNKVSGKTYRYPLVAVNMTDRDVIARVAILFETSVHACRPYGIGKLPYFRAVCSGRNAVGVMKAILPYMGARRSAKIVEVLSEWRERTPTADKRRESCSKAAAKRKRNADGQFVVARR